MDKITIVVMLLGLLIFFSHLLNKLFDKTRIPNVLILMAIGICAGFFVDSNIFFGKIGRVFTTVTLILILFESGVDLKLSELRSSILSATLVTIINFLLTTGIVIGITMWLADFNFISALYMGATLGGTSSAIVIPIVRQMKIGQKARTVLTLESAFTSVLCLVVALAVLEGMKAGDISASSILNKMWMSFLFAIVLGIAGGAIWSLVLNWVRGLKNSMFTTLAFVFIVYGSAELLGLNGGIAALAFGIVLGNSEYFDRLKWWKKMFKVDTAKLNERERNFYSEIVFVLQTYFFVYVGIVMEFGSIMTYLLATLITASIILLRFPTIVAFVRKNCPPHDKLIMSVLMPKGLVSVVLASIPLQEGIQNGQQIAEFGYAVVLTSIIFCSLLIIIIGKKPEKENSQNITENGTDNTEEGIHHL